jgi:hypothetical protein
MRSHVMRASRRAMPGRPPAREVRVNHIPVSEHAKKFGRRATQEDRVDLTSHATREARRLTKRGPA